MGETVLVPDITLIRALLDSHLEMASRRAGRRRPDAPAPTGSRARRHSYLAFLSPRFQQSTLDSTTPEGLTLERLLAADMAVDWTEQERILGFSADGASAGD